MQKFCSRSMEEMRKCLLTLFSALCIFQLNFFLVNSYRFKRAKFVSRKEKIVDVRSSIKEFFLHFYLRPPKTNLLWEIENEVIECEAGGSPPPVIHWLKDGHLLTMETQVDPDTKTDINSETIDNVIERLRIGSTSSRLYLDCVNPQSSGVYTCVAENPYQRISAKSQVTVLPSVPKAVNPCTDKSTPGKMMPRIHMWSQKRFEYMGGDARLFCRTNGNPKPKIRWLGPENENLSQGTNKYQVLFNGDLIIRKLEWNDMGNYVCVATNKYGSDRKETFLYPTAVE